MDFKGSEIWTEKYRPRNFEEIVGQEDIVKRVKKAASERMKKNNPMHDPEIVKKVTETRRKKGNYGKRKNNKKEN